jgi:hypothetical protein
MENSQNMQGAPAQQAPQQGGGDQMQQIMQMAQQMLEQGAQPVEVAAQLLGSQVPPEVVMQVFTELGMAPEEAQATIQEAMQGGQQQQGPGEEMMEGQASNPQEEMMEGAPQGMPQQGGQPSPEEMAMMQQQQGAPQPSDEELQMAFGGPAFDLIQKAFGGKADLNVNSASYVQDRQANFINAIKQNALMNQATKQVFGNDPTSMMYGGVLPKAWDGKDMSGFKTRAEYLEAIADYNADPKNATKLDFTAELAKWKAPATTATNTGQQQTQQVAGQPKYNIIYNYAPPSPYGNSPAARLWNNSGRGDSRVKINGKNVPANFNYSDLFDPGKGAGTANGRNWTATEAEDIRGGLFNRKVVGKKYKINWDPTQAANTPAATTTTGTPGAVVPGAVPGAVVPGATTPAATIPGVPPANEYGLRFDNQGNVLQASAYDPNSFITAAQATEEAANYAKYQTDVTGKAYDPVANKFVETKDKKGKVIANPNAKLAPSYSTFAKYDVNDRISKANAAAKLKMEQDAATAKTTAEQAKVDAEKKVKDDLLAKKDKTLADADAAYMSSTNKLQRIFSSKPSDKAIDYEKDQADAAAEKAYQDKINAANVYLEPKATGGEPGDECPEGMVWSEEERSCVPIATPAESKPMNADIAFGENNKFSANYSGAVGPNGIQTNNVGVGYQNGSTNVNANYDNNNKSIMLNAGKEWNVGKGQLGVNAGYSAPTQGMNKGNFNGNVYYNTQLGSGDRAVPVKVNFGLGQQAFGGVLSSDLHKAAQTIMMAFGGGLNRYALAGDAELGENESEIEVLNKKGKLTIDKNAAADLSKQGMDWITKFATEAQQRRIDKENEGLLSASNGPRSELTNQGWDQFGNFVGGTDTGAEIQNLTNTSNSMNQPVYSLGGRTYALGGQYDLTQEEIELLRANGVNIQKS